MAFVFAGTSSYSTMQPTPSFGLSPKVNEEKERKRGSTKKQIERAKERKRHYEKRERKRERGKERKREGADHRCRGSTRGGWGSGPGLDQLFIDVTP